MSSIKCVKCGFVSWTTAETCKKCGAQLSDPTNPDGTGATIVDRVNRSHRRAKRLCILFAVIILIALASGLLFAFKPIDPNQAKIFVLKDGSKKSSKAWFHSWFSSDPKVEEIVAQYLKVSGWQANSSALTNFVAKGRFQINNEPGATLVTYMPYRATAQFHWSTVEGEVELEAEGPDKLLITQKYYTKVLQRGANGKKGWSRKGWADKAAQVDPNIKLENTKMNEVRGEPLIEFKRGAEFINYFQLANKYPHLYLSGKTMLGDRVAYEVTNRDRSDAMAVMYFDVETGMLLKFWSYRRNSPYIPTLDEYNLPSRDSSDLAEIFLEDYREVNGLKLPFLIRQHFREFWITTVITDLKPNVTIDPSVFQMPAS